MTDTATHGENAMPDARSSGVTLECDGAIAEIGLRSGALNLVNKELLRSLNTTLTDVAARPAVRCVIFHDGTITGKERKRGSSDNTVRKASATRGLKPSPSTMPSMSRAFRCFAAASIP